MARERRFDLLAIGDPCADVLVATTRMPVWDDKTVGSALGVLAGGTEANVACAAARLGLRVAAFGRVGGDAHAALLRDDFVRHGVQVEHLLACPDGQSAMALVFISPHGERAVVWVPASGPAPERTAELEAALRESRIAYTMPYQMAPLRTLAAAAQRCGTQLAIDIERETVLQAGGLAGLLAHADIAFMNETGFSAAFGTAPSRDAVAALCQAGRAHTVVVTLGARGALAADRHGSAEQAAYPAQLVDATGAGDSFNAAFLCAQLRGHTLQQRLAVACAAASRTVAAVGARGALAQPAFIQTLTPPT